jgi:hypothetical protein
MAKRKQYTSDYLSIYTNTKIERHIKSLATEASTMVTGSIGATASTKPRCIPRGIPTFSNDNEVNACIVAYALSMVMCWKCITATVIISTIAMIIYGFCMPPATMKSTGQGIYDRGLVTEEPEKLTLHVRFCAPRSM